MWERHGEINAWEERWWGISDEVGNRIAGILGAAPGTVLVQPNASVALSSVLSCFDFGADERPGGLRSPSPSILPAPFPSGRRKIVTSDLEFPTMEYILNENRRLGAEIETVRSDDGIAIPVDRIIESVDERTALVALSHVSFLSSHRIDPVPVIEKAHRVGSVVLLDVYQSAGVVELDVESWGVDFAIGGTIKWLCGGPSGGYLYARPDLREALRPRLTGWIAHEEPLSFHRGPIRYADSAWRFSQGTPNIPGLYSCLPGLELVEEVGVPAIAAESRRRTQWIVELALEKGWTLNSPADAGHRGGIVMIGVEASPQMVKRLAERNVYVDCRPGVGLRISPHFFTEDSELQEAMAILDEQI